MGFLSQLGAFILVVLIAYLYRPKQNIEHVFNSSDFSETVKPHEGRKRIENPEPGVYVALYYALANVIILSQNGEWLIVDTTESCTVMREIIQDMKTYERPKKIVGLGKTVEKS